MASMLSQHRPKSSRPCRRSSNAGTNVQVSSSDIVVNQRSPPQKRVRTRSRCKYPVECLSNVPRLLTGVQESGRLHGLQLQVPRSQELVRVAGAPTHILGHAGVRSGHCRRVCPVALMLYSVHSSTTCTGPHGSEDSGVSPPPHLFRRWGQVCGRVPLDPSNRFAGILYYYGPDRSFFVGNS
jgi:hypothetical protein